ncbi:MAG TPA: DUF4190 domain-containing protein [Roseiflexaceae bacterium]
MNCTTCGAPLEPGTMFCANCGTRVTAPSVGGAPSEQQVAPAPPPLSQPYDAPTTPQWIAPGQVAYAPASLPNSSAAVVSLIFGILAWLPILPVIGAAVAVVAGHMARNQIKASNGQLGGSGMATIGLILGYLQLALLALTVCVIIGIGILTMLGSRVPAR